MFPTSSLPDGFNCIIRRNESSDSDVTFAVQHDFSLETKVTLTAGGEWVLVTQKDADGGINGWLWMTSYSGASGYSGKSGASGYSGKSGTSGFSGSAGASGTSGTSGFSSYSGTSGFSSYSGASGFSGADGTIGDSGFSGTAGTQGASGFSGIEGLEGTSGFSGYSAPSGTSGASAYSGASGVSAYSGFSAYSGESGVSAYSGFSGAPGEAGESGYSGISGALGPTGATGDSGFSGFSGFNVGAGETVKRTFTQAGHGFAVQNVVYRASGSFELAKADAEATAEAVGIVESVDGDDFTIVLAGYISGLSGLTDASVYYVSKDVAGQITTTEPIGGTEVSKPILIATGTTTGFVVNMRGLIGAGGPDSGYSGFSGDAGETGISGFSRTSGFSGTTGGGVTWISKSANYTANSFEGILADTSGGAWTLTLPESPSVGDIVAVSDATSSFSENNLTVARNGNNIQGEAEDLLCDLNQMTFEFVYTGADEGWMFNPYMDESAGVSMPRGYIDGLVLSNNVGDPNNDIDISVGSCRDDGDSADLILAEGLTKRLDAAWAVGTGLGGLDTGSKANSTWYHVWLIKRSDTNVVDALFSISATAPTMPANYDIKRRIGAILTDGSGNITTFYQYGDRFDWNAAVSDYSAAAPNNSLTAVTLTVPTGVVVGARHAIQGWSADTSKYYYTTSYDATGAAPQGIVTTAPASTWMRVPVAVAYTDTSAQIKHTGSSTGISGIINTVGWIDPRGKDDE